MMDDIDKIMRTGVGEKPNRIISSKDIDESIPLFVISKKGELVDVNNGFCNKIGYTKNEILGKDVEKLDFLTERSKSKLKHRQVCDLIGEETFIPSFDLVTRNGDVSYFEIEIRPCFKDGKVTGEISIMFTSSEYPKNSDELADKDFDITKQIDKKTDQENNLREIEKIQINLNRQKEEIESTNAELEKRNAIIAEIKKQLTEKQTGLIEKNSVTDQLQSELKDQTEVIKSKNEELTTAKKEIVDKEEEISQIRTELENRSRELLNKNVEFSRLKNKLEDTVEEANASKAALRWFKIELEKKQAGLESLNMELETRNNIIREMKNQLADRHTNVVDKTRNVFQLQTELEKKKEDFDVLNTKFQEVCKRLDSISRGKNIGDLTNIKSEIGELDKVLREKQGELASLDKSIELKNQELKELNSKLEENISSLKLVESQLERKEAELSIEEKTGEIPTTEVLKDKLNVNDEIDRHLGMSDNNFKTKKIDEEDIEKL